MKKIKTISIGLKKAHTIFASGLSLPFLSYQLSVLSTMVFCALCNPVKGTELSEAANRTLGLSQCQIVNLPAHAVSSFPMRMEIDFNGQSRSLELSPVSLRGQRFAVYTQGEDGTLNSAAANPSTTFRGKILSETESLVAASFNNGCMLARIMEADGSETWIEPIEERVLGAMPGDHVVYAQRDVLDTHAYCAANEAVAFNIQKNIEGGVAEAGALKVAEIAIDADHEYYLSQGGSVSATQARIESVMNTVNIQYERDVGITHLITTIIVRTDAEDPYTATNSGSLLNDFRSHWNANHQNIARDVAHLFTGKNLDGSTIGIAYLNVICGSSGYGVSQANFSSNFSGITDLIAHELGHNWGAGHCSCSSFTMNPSITSSNIFNPEGTIPTITSFRDNLSCLDDSTSDPPLAPSNLSTTVESHQDIRLAYTDNADNELGFRMERSLNQQDWTLVVSLAADVTSYLDSGLDPSTQYFYRVKAFNTVGDSAYSSTASATTEVEPSNQAPTVANSIPDIAVFQGEPNSVIDLSDVFSDDRDSSLNLSVASLSNSAILSASISDSQLTLDYTNNQLGTTIISIRAADSEGLSVEDSFSVTVVANDGFLSGLTVEYFNFTSGLSLLPDLTSLTPVVVRVENQINQASTSNPWAGLGNEFTNTFACRYSGVIQIESSGDYTFFLCSDDGSKLWIDGVEIIDNDGLHSMRELSQTVALNTGLYEIRTEFFENTGGAGLILSWQGPSFGKEIVPENVLFHGNPNLNTAPTLTNPIADIEVNEGSGDTVIDLSNVFSDEEDPSLILSISDNTNPPLVSTNLNGNSLVLSYSANANGNSGITIRATDSGNLSVEDTFNISVWQSSALLAHYSFEGNADDSSGNGNDGLVKGALLTSGVLGQGYDFDGVNDYMSIQNLKFENSGQLSSLSVSVWIRTNFEGSSWFDNFGIVDFDRSEYFSFFVRGDNGKLGFSTRDEAGVLNDSFGNAAVNDGQWHFVTAVYDGIDKFLYVDGQLDTTEVNPHSGRPLGSGNTRYGFIADGSEASNFDGARNQIHYEGLLDELKLYSRALSQTEILEEFESITVPNPDSGLLASYSFEGNTDDSSSRGNNGENHGVSFMAGISGDYGSFDGVNDYVAIENLQFSEAGELDELSVCSLVNTGVSKAAWFDNWSILDFDRNEYFSFYVRGDNGKLGFSSAAANGGLNDFSGNTSVNNELWHLVCAVYNGNDKILYVDGVEDRRITNVHGGVSLGTGRVTRYGFIGDGSEAVNSNGQRNEFYFDGALDEIRMYSRAISRIEIESMFKQIDFQSMEAIENLGKSGNTPRITANSLIDFPISRTVYEDAEDLTINHWHVYNQGEVLNILGGANDSSRAIQTIGNIESDVFHLANEDGLDWNNENEFLAEFSVSVDKASSGAVYFEVETTDQSVKYLVYIPGQIINYKDPDIIHFDLGDITDGNWHTIYRDLEADLQSAFPESDLLRVKSLFVYGSLRIDDVLLIKKME